MQREENNKRKKGTFVDCEWKHLLENQSRIKWFREQDTYVSFANFYEFHSLEHKKFELGSK